MPTGAKVLGPARWLWLGVFLTWKKTMVAIGPLFPPLFLFDLLRHVND